MGLLIIGIIIGAVVNYGLFHSLPNIEEKKTDSTYKSYRKTCDHCDGTKRVFDVDGYRKCRKCE